VIDVPATTKWEVAQRVLDQIARLRQQRKASSESLRVSLDLPDSELKESGNLKPENNNRKAKPESKTRKQHREGHEFYSCPSRSPN